MLTRFFFSLLFVLLSLQNPTSATPEERAKMEAQNAELRAILQAAPRLPMEQAAITVHAPQQDGWALGMVSWVASDRNGLVYLLQRGDKADPVVVLDRTGQFHHDGRRPVLQHQSRDL